MAKAIIQAKPECKVLCNKKLYTKATTMCFSPTDHTILCSVTLQSVVMFSFLMISTNHCCADWWKWLRTLTCARVSSHVAQRAQRSEHRVPVIEVVQAELDARLVAVMDHGQLRRAVSRWVAIHGDCGGRSSESTSTDLRSLGADGGEVRGHAEYEVFDFDKVVGADAGRLVHQEHNVGLAPPTAWNGDRWYINSGIEWLHFRLQRPSLPHSPSWACQWTAMACAPKTEQCKTVKC